MLEEEGKVELEREMRIKNRVLGRRRWRGLLLIVVRGEIEVKTLKGEVEMERGEAGE
jgi:hypothetical protein